MNHPSLTVWVRDLLLLLFLSVGFCLLSCHAQEEEEAAAAATVAPMERNEQEALYSAIQGFTGKSWNGSDLYPDPCGWTPIQGVSCDLFDGLWHVTVMNIGPVYDNSIRCAQDAIFSHHLFEFSHLNSLSIFNCFSSPSKNPTRIPSSNWEKLATTLKSLEFRSNPGLTGSIPTSFGYLNNLQCLVILENGLTGNLPVELANLVKLRRLVLAGNQFTGRIPATLGGLTELLILDFSWNSLSGPMPLTFGNLTSLLKLDLSYNKLNGKLPKEIGNLRNVTLLDLRSNNFSGGFVQSVQEMASLKEMAVSDNPTFGGGLDRIRWRNLQDLEILDLCNMGLVGAIPKSVAEMRRLRFLGLSDNNLTGDLPKRLATMPSSIRALYVNGNDLTGELQISSDCLFEKLGRRFRAWSNPRLCYKSSSGYVPYGVRPCSVM